MSFLKNLGITRVPDAYISSFKVIGLLVSEEKYFF